MSDTGVSASEAAVSSDEIPVRSGPSVPPKSNGSDGEGFFTRSGKIRLLKLEDLDRRTNAAKAAFEFRDALADERGGVEQLGVLKSAMLDSVAVLSAGIRHLETLWLSGKPIDMTELATLLNARRRRSGRRLWASWQPWPYRRSGPRRCAWRVGGSGST
jgi:hypothetical protein